MTARALVSGGPSNEAAERMIQQAGEMAVMEEAQVIAAEEVATPPAPAV